MAIKMQVMEDVCIQLEEDIQSLHTLIDTGSFSEALEQMEQVNARLAELRQQILGDEND